MANRTILNQIGEGVGAIAGVAVGVVVGGVHAGVEYIKTGDATEAGKAFEKTGDICVQNGAEIGDQLAPALAAAAAVALAGKTVQSVNTQTNKKALKSNFMDETINNPTTNSNNKIE